MTRRESRSLRSHLRPLVRLRLLPVACCLLPVPGSAVSSCAAPKPADPAAPGVARTTVVPGAVAAPAPPGTPLSQPFVAVASPSDVVSPWVNPEHSSRLVTAMPKGRAHEAWVSALDPTLDPVFVMAVGTRVVVQGRARGAAGARQTPFVVLDGRGVRVGNDLAAGEHLRIDPAAGKLFGIGGTDTSAPPSAWQLADATYASDKLDADDPRGVAGPLAVRATSHRGTHVFITRTNVEIDERSSQTQRSVVEPPVVPLDAAIDEDANLNVIVRQERDLALWTTPLSGGSVGRIRIGPLRRERNEVPPILGKTIRVVVVDDRMIALGRDGKTVWERKGALTGGATLTADDHLLVASDARLLDVDPAGKATEIANAPKEIFLTPPILTAAGLLLVASGTALHAYAFE